MGTKEIKPGKKSERTENITDTCPHTSGHIVKASEILQTQKTQVMIPHIPLRLPQSPQCYQLPAVIRYLCFKHKYIQTHTHTHTHTPKVL